MPETQNARLNISDDFASRQTLMLSKVRRPRKLTNHNELLTTLGSTLLTFGRPVCLPAPAASSTGVPDFRAAMRTIYLFPSGSPHLIGSWEARRAFSTATQFPR